MADILGACYNDDFLFDGDRDDAEYYADMEEDYYYEDNMSDVEADADTLASCGWGTDEDYGYFGEDDYGW